MQLPRVSMASLADDPSVFVKGMMQTLVATVRASHMLPSNEEEFEYQVLRGQGARPRARSSLAPCPAPTARKLPRSDAGASSVRGHVSTSSGFAIGQTRRALDSTHSKVCGLIEKLASAYSVDLSIRPPNDARSTPTHSSLAAAAAAAWRVRTKAPRLAPWTSIKMAR